MSYMFINTLYIYIYAYEKIFLRFKIVKKKKKKKISIENFKGISYYSHFTRVKN